MCSFAFINFFLHILHFFLVSLRKFSGNKHCLQTCIHLRLNRIYIYIYIYIYDLYMYRERESKRERELKNLVTLKKLAQMK